MTWFNRFNIIAALSVLLVTIIICFGRMYFPGEWFPIKHVKIEGSFKHVQHDHLKAMVLPFVQTGFFQIDMQAMQSQVTAMAWVAESSIRRVWPDTLVLRIVERKPYVRWGEFALLSESAVLFRPDPETISRQLPMIFGPRGTQEVVLTEFKKMNKILSPLTLSISELNMTARRAWRVRLDNGLLIELGRSQPLAQLSRFAKSYHRIFAHRENQVSYVDLRYPNGMAVKYRNKFEAE